MRTLQPWLVALVTLHSIGVGVALLFAPTWSCQTVGGWTTLGPIFFPRQAGVFHFVLAFAYAWEFLRWRGVTIMVAAKLTALVFLLSSAALDHVPWIVPSLGVADGAMGLVVWAVHRAARRAPINPP